MEYFLEFHWWYLLIPVVLLVIFGGKGGMVVKQYSAELEVLDPRFASTTTEATYSFFKNGRDEKIEIEVENLSIPVGDTLDILLNGSLLKTITVKKDLEAEYERWKDNRNPLPNIQPGDEIVITYQGQPAFKGVFRQSIG